jgi:PPM family protein phosphatase
MPTLSAHKTDVGRGSKNNQDYIWVNEPAGVFIVADGMGGHEAGEVASELAATVSGQFILTHLRGEPLPPKELLIGALEAANEAMLAKSQAMKQDRPMGAAIVAAYVQPPTAYICHAGDARAYLVRGSTLTQLTTDDSWVANLLASGLITEEQAQHHPLGHILTKALGHESPLEPAFTEVTVLPGDWLLLCCDGYWKMVGDEQTQAEFQKAGATPARLVEALVDAANAAGGKDNISVIIIHITGAA